jgi:hypothetical protein
MRVPKLLRTTALATSLIAASVPLSVPANAAWGGWHGGWGGWHGGGGWGWGGVGLGLAAGALIGGAIAASSYGYGYPAYGSAYGYGYPAYSGYSYPAYGYGYDTGYSYPAYGSGYGTGYNYPAYGAYRSTYHPVVRRHIYATAAGVHHYRHSH